MSIKRIRADSKVICQNKNSMFNYFAWPSVGRMCNGALAMVCSGLRTCHIDPFGKVVICYSYDEGKTWTPPAVIVDTPMDCRDAGIITFGKKTMITTFTNGIDEQLVMKKRSVLAGTLECKKIDNIEIEYLNWIDKELAEASYSGSLYIITEDGYNFGEIGRAPINAPHGPCLDRKGGLFYAGNPFVQFEEKPDWERCTNVSSRISNVVCYTVDKDMNFTYLSTIEAPVGELYVEPHAVVLDDRIIVMIRENKTLRLKQCVSFDGGKTFTQPQFIEGVDRGIPPHIIQHSNGTLICVYGGRKEPYGQRVMFSADKGETWDVEYVLRDDGIDRDLGYPATIELEDGRLLTVYYQKESGHNNCVIMQSIWELPEKYNK